MKKFNVIMEVWIDDKEYENTIKDNREPSDFVNAVLTDRPRDLGFVIKSSVQEEEHSLYDRLVKYRDHLMQADAYNDLEQEIIARACVGGVCED
jgi:hypothetical protein